MPKGHKGASYRLNGNEFQQALGDGKGQRSLAWYRPWCHKELDMTEQLDNLFSIKPAMPKRVLVKE